MAHWHDLSTINPMLLQAYNPIWPQQFTAIATVLLAALAPLGPQIEHVGSTAVPELAAKPIIDIDIVYQQAADFGGLCQRLDGLGYRHQGNQGIAGREVFKRGNHEHPVLDNIPHHLYACLPNNAELQRHLLFRDYLRQNALARDYYQRLKQRLAVEAGQDRKKYARLKEQKAGAFVGFVVELAAADGEAMFTVRG